MCTLLSAVLVLPLGLGFAQDYDAVERRLGRAVGEGELTLKQAVMMMDALRDSARDDEGCREKRIEIRLEGVGRRLKEAVAKGKLS